MLDGDGTVLRWSCAAADLLGLAADEVCGHPVRELLADDADRVRTTAPCTTGIPSTGRALLRHRSGRPVDVTFWTMRLEDCSDVLALAAPTQRLKEWEHGVSFLSSLLSQERSGSASATRIRPWCEPTSSRGSSADRRCLPAAS
ncbi:PAS domain-containing protein [Streptomyces carpinensis]|uniref:PAS domain-containing protein n=1 Tax=Streptomyces carpinensis TaxID=66369 RepID=A0ABV1WDF6_9ACTN